MTRQDLNEDNGWIPEEQGSTALQALFQNSVVEQVARHENMVSRTKAIPRFAADAPNVVAEGTNIPEATLNLDEIILVAQKWAKILNISEEDMNDSLVDVLNTYKTEWVGRYARKFDNACLGVSTAKDNTDTAPYQSVFAAATAAGRVTSVAGDLSFDNLNDSVAAIEGGDYFDAANTVFITHPKMLGNLRNLKDDSGLRVVDAPLNGTPGSFFGYPLYVSRGAAVSTAASSAPTGDPLLIAGNSKLLVVGDRSGVESQLSDQTDFRLDNVLLKVRTRKAFAVADPAAFTVIRKTA
jgi:HK97 family phage major capsid protein